jgi:predicted ATPase with chaperone activity
MPLIRKMMEPLAAVSKKEEREEDTLFLRLQDVAGAHGGAYACTVQGTGGEFIVVLSDPDTGKEVCAWSGLDGCGHRRIPALAGA